MSRLSKYFLELLLNLSQLKNRQFPGIGLLLYKDLQGIEKYHCSLVNDIQAIPSLQLGSEELFHYLLEISHYTHPYHDGFHFINQEGQLTHVAQFLSPPIDSDISNVRGQGARTLCALFGSNIQDVSMIGTVSANKHIHLYKNGKIATEIRCSPLHC